MASVTFAAHWAGVAGLVGFLAAYALAMAEERLHVRKSVPVLLAAGLVWVLVGLAYAGTGQAAAAGELARRTLLDFSELFLFLIPAMTFVNTLEERGLFHVLRARLVASGLSLRAVFWVTGALAFVVSPIADNLTTALLLGTVAIAVGRGHPRFVPLACINIVVAANAGGAFSPFGDITTLMVWQAGRIPFSGFFALALPSLLNWLVPAMLLALFIHGRPGVTREQQPPALEAGALPVLVLFLATIALTVTIHTFLDLPPALGMMAGLGLLKGYSYLFNLRHPQPPLTDELDDVFAEAELEPDDERSALEMLEPGHPAGRDALESGARVALLTLAPTATEPTVVAVPVRAARPLDIFALLEKLEWDTLMFFYGVLLCVGGLGAFGYLALLSQGLYGGSDPTLANVAIGLLSALVDNVPVMFAVLTMAPALSEGQWLLVTLTTGVGGSLLSIGSAAGVALMGQARGVYTFGAHLRWSWAIALGYVASIAAHRLVNAALFG